MSAHEHLPSVALFAAAGSGAAESGGPPLSVVPPIERGYYTARLTPDLRAFVQHPDGLTWETRPGDHPSLESAQAHALKLNIWLDAKPDGTMIDPFFDPFISLLRDTSVEALLRIFADERWAA